MLYGICTEALLIVTAEEVAITAPTGPRMTWRGSERPVDVRPYVKEPLDKGGVFCYTAHVEDVLSVILLQYQGPGPGRPIWLMLCAAATKN